MNRFAWVTLAFMAAGCSDFGVQTFNAIPVADITSHETDDTVLEGYTVTIRGSASDPDDQSDELGVRWFVDDEKVCPNADVDDEGVTTCALQVGGSPFEVTLEVFDPDGASDAKSIALLVTPTEAPEATIVSPIADGLYYSDERLTFEGIVSDAEEAPIELTVWWESDLDGELEIDINPDASGSFVAAAYLTEGSHLITLNVRDGSEKTAFDSVVVDVGGPNSAPSCTLDAPIDGSVHAISGALDLRATVSDPDQSADTLAISIDSSVDGNLATPTATTGGDVITQASGLSAATHVITLTVTDSRGEVCSDVATVAVSTKPNVVIASPGSGTWGQNSSITFVGIVTDAEDDSSDLIADWDSDLDGWLDTDNPDGTGSTTFVTSSLSIGTHEITLTGTDTTGLTNTNTVSIVISEQPVNHLPTQPVITLEPNPATAADNLTVVFSQQSTDADGDTVTYTYDWFKNGAPSPFSSTGIMSWSFTTKGETWSVQVTPYDLVGAGPSASANTTILNSLPVLNSVTLTPNPANTTTTVYCLAAGLSDLDNEPVDLTYEWRVNGTIAGSNADSLDSSEFIRGDEVTCTVVPNDGEADGSPVTSSTLVISNAPPTAPEVEFEPPNPTTNDELVCVIVTDSVDPDGDAVTYDMAFDDSGTPYVPSQFGGTYLLGDTVPSVELDQGDTWTCTVTPNDTFENGTPGEASAFVNDFCGDGDNDGYTDASCGGDDCDDGNNQIHPFAGDQFGDLDAFGDPIDTDCDGLDCQAGYYNFTTYFTACGDMAGWDDARDICSNAGYQLASIRDSGEQAYIDGLLQSGNLFAQYSLWIGINDQSSEGTFVWEDGWSGGYEYWGLNEPNNENGNEDCGQINWPVDVDAEWNDALCTLATVFSGYVCQVR